MIKEYISAGGVGYVALTSISLLLLIGKFSVCNFSKIYVNKKEFSIYLLFMQCMKFVFSTCAYTKNWIVKGIFYRWISRLIFLLLGSQVSTNIWLSLWSDDPFLNGTAGAQQTSFRLGVYAGLGAVQSE